MSAERCDCGRWFVAANDSVIDRAEWEHTRERCFPGPGAKPEPSTPGQITADDILGCIHMIAAGGEGACRACYAKEIVLRLGVKDP